MSDNENTPTDSTPSDAVVETVVEAVEATPAPAPVPTPVVIPTPNELPRPAAKESDEDEVVFTANDVERIVQTRVGRLNKQHARDLEQARAAAGGADLSALEQEKAAIAAELNSIKAEYSVRFAAVAAGVPADQTDAIVKLADVSTAVVDGVLDTSKVDEAVKAVIEKFPGLIGSVGSSAPAPAVGSGPSSADPKATEANSLMDAVIRKYSR